MHKSSRRGAALVYVILVTAVLMVLVSSLVFLAGVSRRTAQTSLAGRQAYLDAKSAVSYGRAYVRQFASRQKEAAMSGLTMTAVQADHEPGFLRVSSPVVSGGKLASFTAAGSGIAVSYTGGEDTAAPGSLHVNAPYHYGGRISSADAAAAGRVYRMGFRFTKLTYTPVTPVQPVAPPSTINDFLFMGYQYNNGQQILSSQSPSAVYVLPGSRTSAYPIIAQQEMQCQDNETGSLTVPQLYLMYPQALQSYKASVVTIHTDFICVNGSVSGQGYTGYPNGTKSQFLLNGKSQPNPIVYFPKDCKFTYGQDSSNPTVSLVIPKGYYQFTDGKNFFDIQKAEVSAGQNVLKDAKGNVIMRGISESSVPPIVDKTQVQRVIDAFPPNYGENGVTPKIIPSFVSGSDSVNAHWTDENDSVSGGTASSGFSSKDFTDTEVAWYVASTANWEQAFKNNKGEASDYQAEFHFTPDQLGIQYGWNQKDQNKFGIYRAKGVYLNYVNASAPFTVPAGNTVVLQTNLMWFNSALTDGAAGGGKPITAGDANSHLYLTSLNFKDSVTVTFPADVTVQYAGNTYTIHAGTYLVQNQFDLFSEAAKAFFERNGGQQEGGGTPPDSPGNVPGTEDGDPQASAEESGYYTQR